MAHLLDNMIWNAITTGNTGIATVDGDVGFYHPDIAPFAGMKEVNKTNLDKLYSLLPAGRKMAISYFDNIDLDKSKWETLANMHCCQMVYENPVDSFVTEQTPLVQRLTDEHIPQMLELTRLTKPGPFYERTILFGNYFGVFDGDKLVAMTGQRMHPIPYLEVSAVCTHPGYRGKGYAKAILLQVMKLILEQSFTPFLHVLSSNETAIKLYESVGLTIRTKLYIDMLRRL